MKRIALILTATMVACAWAAAQARADDARKQFFHDVKRAQLFDGAIVNCCGEGDATRAKVIASSGDVLAVQIIAPMRHPTAKAGEVVTVPRRLIVRNPISPERMGTILFLGTSSDPALRRPYCLVQKRAGG